MNGFTIKSTSAEGVYYLTKDWRKNRTLWVGRNALRQEHLYKTAGHAKAGLKALLKVMTEYTHDEFAVVHIGTPDCVVERI